MFARFEEEDEENVTWRCFVSTTAHKSLMMSQVRSLFKSFNIPNSAYNSFLSEFDEAITYVNDLLISASSDAKRSKKLLLDTQRCLESKKSKIDHLDLH